MCAAVLLVYADINIHVGIVILCSSSHSAGWGLQPGTFRNHRSTFTFLVTASKPRLGRCAEAFKGSGFSSLFGDLFALKPCHNELYPPFAVTIGGIGVLGLAVSKLDKGFNAFFDDVIVKVRPICYVR